MTADALSPAACRCLMHLIGGRTVDLGVLRGEQASPAPHPSEPLNQLTAWGCRIETTGIDSVRLAQTDLRVWQDYLDWALPHEGVLPMVVRVYRETASTQDVAKNLAPARAVVVADRQTRGRGRLGRRWEATPGSAVLMSVVWPYDSAVPTHDRVSMLVGVAIARAVERLVPQLQARLKWPNDVMVDGHKLAGVLIEAVQGAYVIGIGLNVTECPPPDAVKTPATDLARLGCTADRLGVVEQLIVDLDRTLRHGSNNELIDEWRARATLGERREFKNNGQRIAGTVLDLDADAGLIVRRDTGEIVTLPAASTSVVA